MKIPLSFIIEYTAQIIFPSLYRLFVIKPIFPKQRDNLVINYEFHPFVCTGDLILSTEIAVTDLKSFPQGIILFYLLMSNVMRKNGFGKMLGMEPKEDSFHTTIPHRRFFINEIDEFEKYLFLWSIFSKEFCFIFYGCGYR